MIGLVFMLLIVHLKTYCGISAVTCFVIRCLLIFDCMHRLELITKRNELSVLIAMARSFYRQKRLCPVSDLAPNLLLHIVLLLYFHMARAIFISFNACFTVFPIISNNLVFIFYFIDVSWNTKHAYCHNSSFIINRNIQIHLKVNKPKFIV